MRRVLIATAILAVTALPSFAAEVSTPFCQEQGGEMGQKMQQHPEMMKQMMRNPSSLLMMAYHKNVMIFGRMLAKVARQGDTVPREVARPAVAEMRRSVEEMEKYRVDALRNMPAEMKGDMQKTMDEHLVNVKTHLRQLDELTRSDRIPSGEVLKHLLPIFEGCGEQMEPGCGHRHHGAMNCGERQGNMDCGCGNIPPGMMPGMEHRRMMEEQFQKMKSQDADLTKQVEAMTRAPKEKKVDLLADIVSRMVQQRVEMTNHFEQMRTHMMQQQDGMSMHHRPAPMPPPTATMNGSDEDEDLNMDDVNMDED